MIFAGIGLRTRNVKRLAAFYKNALGCQSDCDEDDEHQEMLTNGAFLAIAKGEAAGNEALWLAFTVDDVDAEHERLKAFGVEIDEPPTTRPWGARNMSFRDPDGNHIVFRTFTEVK